MYFTENEHVSKEIVPRRVTLSPGGLTGASESRWEVKEGRECPTLSSRAPATRHIGSAKEPQGHGHDSQGETWSGAFMSPFPGLVAAS